MRYEKEIFIEFCKFHLINYLLMEQQFVCFIDIQLFPNQTKEIQELRKKEYTVCPNKHKN